MNKVRFIPEVEGLRGIAVLSVLLFHLNKSFLPGGYLGVDIFFAISGFLITSISISEFAATGSISIAEFYRKRIKRIIPLFSLVVLVTLIAGYLLFLPDYFLLLGRSIAASLTFTSNFFFSQNLDYFANNSNEYPLLHTWSLSIEEQFYFIWPLVLILSLRKFELKSIFKGLVVAIIASLIFADALRLLDASSSGIYFNSLPRFGEIAIGACLAFLFKLTDADWNKKFHRHASFLGLLLLAVSVIVINDTFWFPGLLCLVPCGGAALIIWGSRSQESHWGSRLLNNKYLRKVGDFSYSLYLWHWPVLAFTRYLTGSYEIPLHLLLIDLVLMFSLSYITRYFFENKFIALKWNLPKVFAVLLLVPFGFFWLATSSIEKNEGVPQRISHIEQFETETSFIEDKYCHNLENEECLFGNLKSHQRIYLIGDSNAGHFTPFIVSALGKSYLIEAKTVDTCPPLLSLTNTTKTDIKNVSNEHCFALLDQFKEDIGEQDIIVLAANWGNYISSFKDFEKDFRRTLQLLAGHKVVVIGRIPGVDSSQYNQYLRETYSPLYQKFELKSHISKLDLHNSLKPQTNANAKIKAIASEFNYVKFLDPLEINSNFWKTAPLSKENILVYKDAGHLNQYGSDLWGKLSAVKVQLIFREL
ncbi:acyltransferase family protein [Bdellovibrio svalbardensis]|uniref:Acyltransferase n=1 Tax=Bdellovibrio svalbardensis TaxID=2972972 RepID=A0ABT6DRD0_9BACT|nr:acyltransferase family protein [Bdellovibrio svalbardensis]MDG0817713.1 acyltransferase [Bdellovibrio svalbardensis]